MFLMLTAASVSFAQISVTFQVDMNKQTVGSNGVHVAGSFQAAAGYAGDWDPSTAELTDGDGDGVFTLTVMLPTDSTYGYKFVNGNAWGSDEGIPTACNVGGNRELKVPASGPYTIPTVCFASCEACPSAVDTVAFTIMVDMTNETVSGNGVHVAGGFGGGGYPNWDPAGIALTDANSDKVYEVTLNLPEGEYPFKFVNGNAWGSDEGIPGECATGGNRAMKLIGDGDNDSESGFTASYIAAFGACPPSDSVDVTFMVDMTNQTVGANGVHLAGAFGQAGHPNWDPSAIELTDANTDNIYEVTLRLSEGEYAHKFVNGNAWGGDEAVPPACNVGGNRAYNATGNGDAWSDILTASVTVCFGECESTCPTKLPPIDVTFRVDMSNEIVNASGVFLAGAFPNVGWIKDTLKMTDDNGDDVFEYKFTDLPVDDYQFKFYNGDCGDPDCAEDYDFKANGCGVDNGVGGFNRYIDLLGVTNDTIIDAIVYNTCATSMVSVINTLPNKFKVYPNPANGLVNVAFKKEADNYTISLLDFNGRLVLSQTSSEKEISININAVKAGMYMLMISDNMGSSAYQKLIVQ